MRKEIDEILEEIERLEVEAHALWDEAFGNCAMSNPSLEQREEYAKNTYKATQLHATAMAKLTGLMGAAGEPSETPEASDTPIADKSPCEATSPASMQSVSTRELLIKLLEVATCPNCDGSGSIPHQVSEDEWEAEQCQWCAERDEVLKATGEEGRQ